MAKKLSIEITPTQARALIWAMNAFEMAYEGGSGFEDIDRDHARAVKNLENIYIAAANFANENGK